MSLFKKTHFITIKSIFTLSILLTHLWNTVLNQFEDKRAEQLKFAFQYYLCLEQN